MLLVGVSLVLADRGSAPPAHRAFRIHRSFLAPRRDHRGCACWQVPAASCSFAHLIYFGMLMRSPFPVLALPLVRRPRLAVAIGAAVVAFGFLLSHPAFDRVPLVDWIRDPKSQRPRTTFPSRRGAIRAARHRRRTRAGTRCVPCGRAAGVDAPMARPGWGATALRCTWCTSRFSSACSGSS
jgi:hypothetical protein